MSPEQISKLILATGLQSNTHSLSYGLQIAYSFQISPEAFQRMSEEEAKHYLYQQIARARDELLRKADRAMIGLGVKL